MSTNTSSSSSPVANLITLVIVAFVVAGMWKMFTKANQPGWAAIVPIYNTYVLLKIAGRPGWWLVLYLIPLVNLVVNIVVSLDVAKKFGKSGVFGFFGLAVFAPIGYLILGFGDAQYNGGGNTPAAA